MAHLCMSCGWDPDWAPMGGRDESQSVRLGLCKLCQEMFIPAPPHCDGVQGMHRHNGAPDIRWEGFVAKRDENGRPHHNAPWLIKRYAEDGLDWGTDNTCATDLALNILHIFIPADSGDAPTVMVPHRETNNFHTAVNAMVIKLYVKFKVEILSLLDYEEAHLSAGAIRKWIDANS